MTERSLFNVVCKSTGLFVLLQGVSSTAWAFIASRYEGSTLFEPSEGASWFTGAVFTAIGLLLCCRSSSVTRFLFRLDSPLDEANENTNL